MRLKMFGFVALVWVASLSSVWAQCTGQAPPGYECGNANASQGFPTFYPQSSLLDRAFGSTQGTVLYRGASTWGATASPVLGIPNTTTGQLGLAGSSSGTATIAAQPAAGTPTLLLPNTSGTLPSTAASPLLLNATTGQLTCPTCLTASGSLVATAPLNLTGNTLSLQGGNGTLAQGSGGTGSAFTATPTIGVAGSTVGSLSFANLTSGTEKIQPAIGALGSGVATLPAGTYNIVGDSLLQTITNKTLTTPTINGASLSGTFSGNATFSGQLIATGTTSPASAAGNSVVLGTLASGPTLSNTAQAFFYNTAISGAVVQGQGSTCDVNLLNKNATGALCVITGTQNVQVDGSLTIGLTGTTTGSVIFEGSTSGSLTLQPPSATLGSAVLTFPDTTDTLVARNSTDTLSNKTLASPAFTGTVTGNGTIPSAVLNPTAPIVCFIVSTSATTCNNGGSSANNGTYTPPAGAKWIAVRMVGGGAGGAGGGTSPGTGVAGGNTTFGTSLLTANGGAIQAGAGGSASGGYDNQSGGSGGAGVLSGTTGIGGPGGASGCGFGSSSFGVLNGSPTPPGGFGNGSAGGGSNTSTIPGAGGSAAGCLIALLTSLNPTYSYAIGSAGTAGAAGTNGQAGAAGTPGAIEVIAYFQ